MKILIIRFSSLGDILLTTPFIALVRESYPDASIFFATKKKFSSLLEGNSALTQVLCLENHESLFSFAKKIKKQLKSENRFELVFDLHNSLRSRLLRRLLPQKKLYFYKKPYFKRWLLVRFKLNLLPVDEPVSLRYMKVLKPLGVHPKMLPSEILTKKSEVIRQISFKAAKKKIIAVAPGARWYTKAWPIEYFLITAENLLNQFKRTHIIIFLGSAEEAYLGKKIEEVFHKRIDKQIFNFIGKLSIQESFSALSYAEVLLCNDSALMHGAHLLGVKILPLFLSTVPEFGFLPWGLTQNDIISRPIKCKPCDHKGLNQCPKKHFKCAHLIRTEEVTERMIKILRV